MYKNEQNLEMQRQLDQLFKTIRRSYIRHDQELEKLLNHKLIDKECEAVHNRYLQLQKFISQTVILFNEKKPFHNQKTDYEEREWNKFCKAFLQEKGKKQYELIYSISEKIKEDDLIQEITFNWHPYDREVFEKEYRRRNACILRNSCILNKNKRKNRLIVHLLTDY